MQPVGHDGEAHSQPKVGADVARAQLNLYIANQTLLTIIEVVTFTNSLVPAPALIGFGSCEYVHVRSASRPT